MFGKIFDDIFDSSLIVHGGDAVYVFIAMIVLSDQEGYLRMHPSAFATRIGKEVDVVLHAIQQLEKLDPESATPTHDGRRIISLRELTGGTENRGWFVVNKAKYRGMTDPETVRAQTRERVRKHRNNKDVTSSNAIVTDVTSSNAQKRHTDTDADTYKKTMSGKPDSIREQAIEILQFVNSKTGKAYKPVAANIELIVARLKEGFTAMQVKQVIAKKTREWSSDEKMSQYLRPKTLFNRTNFANYAGELVVKETAHG